MTEQLPYAGFAPHISHISFPGAGVHLVHLEIYPRELFTERYGKRISLDEDVTRNMAKIVDYVRMDENGLSLRNAIIEKYILISNKKELGDRIIDILRYVSRYVSERRNDIWYIIFQCLLKEDILEGFKIGADDYITKPFSMEELTFRIEAILRRVRGKRNKESNIYKIGRFTFDTQKQILSIDGKNTKLTTKESELLGLLCAHANEILQRDFALKTIWIDDNYFNARSMDVYITKLRKHLKEDDSIEIINIHGKGYKLITPEVE